MSKSFCLFPSILPLLLIALSCLPAAKPCEEDDMGIYVSDEGTEGLMLITAETSSDASRAATGTLVLEVPEALDATMLILVPTTADGSPTLNQLQFTVSGAEEVELKLSNPATVAKTVDTVTVSVVLIR